MRVLMVGPWRMLIMRRLIDWAAESGIEVTVADFQYHDDTWLPSGVHRARLWPDRAPAVGQTVIQEKSRRAVCIGSLRLRAIAEAFQPHVIHSYALNHYTDICLEAGLNPLLVSASGFMNRWLTTPTSNDRRWLRRLRRGAHTLLVQNSNLMQVLVARPHDPLRLECLPLGVDGSLFHPGHQQEAAAWRFALDIPTDAIVLLSPRGWAQIYGQQYIMQAFAAAYHKLDRPVVLVLLGMGRMKRPERLGQEVHDLGVSLGVGHAIRWIREVPHHDMPGVYALSDIVINYPWYDAFPSTLLEAAACARPVITSILPAYNNTFIERFCRLVEPRNPAALADAIIEIVSSGLTMWVDNVQQARQAVLDEFEEGVQRQRLLALYHQIAAESAAAKQRSHMVALQP